MSGIDAVVAGIDIAVMLDHERTAALLGVNTDRRRISDPSIECPLKIHHKDRAHIPPNPFLIDRDQKISVFFREN